MLIGNRFLPFFDMGKVLKYLIVLTLFLACFFWGRQSIQPEVIVENRVVRDTIREEVLRVDTMWRTRVVTERLPAEIKHDTIVVRDTALVEVPIYLYVKQTDDYKIEVEGFNVEFKSVEFYPKIVERVVTQNIKNRWGLGVQVGYGISDKCMSPYIGVGISYNIITW